MRSPERAPAVYIAVSGFRFVTSILVAVDGGGSGSRALVFERRGRALALFEGPPLNYAVLGPTAFLENLRSLLGPVLREFGKDVGGYVFSLAGISAYRREVEELLRREIGPVELWVLTDIEAAYAAAARGRDAILVSSGTGSFAYGRRGRAEARAGGWGYLFGDEGSAYWIGREFVRRSLMRYDGRLGVGDTSLRLLLEELGAAGVSDALGRLYREYAAPSRVAELAKLACRAAELGCELALELMGDAARELERMVSAVERKLGFEEGAVVYGTGSAVLGCRPLSDALRFEVESRRGRRFEVRRAPPLLGCVLYYMSSIEGYDVESLEKVGLPEEGLQSPGPGGDPRRSRP